MNERLGQRLGAHGIAIVELLVALTLLATVLVSLAASSMYASRALTRSRAELEAMQFLQIELERLHAVPYTELAGGDTTLAVGTSSWTIADSGSYSRITLITHYNPTVKVSKWDTLVAYRLRR